MKIPSSVSIGGTTYGVCVEPQSKLNKTCDGTIEYADQKITLEGGLASGYTKRVFLHECIHGMMYALGMHSQDHDERLVDGLSHQLYSFIESNPDIFRE